MGLIQVPNTFSWELWRQRTNLLGQAVGDFDLLDASIVAAIAPNVDIVHALNHVLTQTGTGQRSVLIRAIAMS
jgi:hypothetical protein